MIGRSETIGCFQIESPGQRELVKKLAPRDVADLIVDISLFRPGPVNSDMIGPFLRTRHGLAEPRYPHEKLETALRETGGVVVFHEQVLRVIDVMTGCGLAEADLVRRHLSKEGGPERTAPWFRAQALARGFDPATVERVWQVVAAFGGFGFCKAHAAAFAIPVYQSAWLRRHHPAAFYAGVLTHDPGMYPKRVIIADARLSGVQVLPVDINASSADWTGRKSIIPNDFGDFPRIPGGSRATASPRRPGSPPVSSRTRRTVPARRLLESTGPLQALQPPRPQGLPRGRSSASPQAIRCSLREVKGISDAEIARIVSGQPYTSLRDFWNRAGVSRPVAERLVLIGAFDSLYTPTPALAPPPAPARSLPPPPCSTRRPAPPSWPRPSLTPPRSPGPRSTRCPAPLRLLPLPVPPPPSRRPGPHRAPRPRRSVLVRPGRRRVMPVAARPGRCPCRAALPRPRRAPPGGTCSPGSGCWPGSPTRPGTGRPRT